MKITAIFATSLDGKIAPADKTGYTRMGSDADIQHLHEKRDEAQAVIFGAETFRAYSRPRRGTSRDYVPLHVILTKNFDLKPDSTFFMNHPPVSTVIFSPSPASDNIKSQYPAHIEWKTFAEPAEIKAFLEGLNVQQAMLEGGGEIMSMFLEAGLVDDIYLTLCPYFLGGQDSPDILGGAVSSSRGRFDLRHQLEVVSIKRMDTDLLLYGKFKKK